MVYVISMLAHRPSWMVGVVVSLSSCLLGQAAHRAYPSFSIKIDVLQITASGSISCGLATYPFRLLQVRPALLIPLFKDLLKTLFYP